MYRPSGAAAAGMYVRPGVICYGVSGNPIGSPTRPHIAHTLARAQPHGIPPQASCACLVNRRTQLKAENTTRGIIRHPIAVHPPTHPTPMRSFPALSVACGHLGQARRGLSTRSGPARGVAREGWAHQASSTAPAVGHLQQQATRPQTAWRRIKCAVQVHSCTVSRAP